MILGTSMRDSILCDCDDNNGLEQLTHRARIQSDASAIPLSVIANVASASGSIGESMIFAIL